MFETLSFHNPFALLLIGLFLLLDYFKSPKADAYYIPHTELFTTIHTPSSKVNTLLKYIMILSAILALANPTYTLKKHSDKHNALDIMIALDVSGSMSLYGFDAKDYNKTRLCVVKEVVSDFIQKRVDDRIGLVAFGTHSRILSPLSFDKDPQIQLVQGLEIGSLGKSTALVDAIVSATKVLKTSPAKSKIIIILSDGEDSSSQIPLNIALKLAKKYHIKIYTIIIDKSSSNMMQHIAKTQGTQAYNPHDKDALKQVYEKIDKLEKSTLSYATISVKQPLYQYFLALSLFCALALLFRRKAGSVI